MDEWTNPNHSIAFLKKNCSACRINSVVNGYRKMIGTGFEVSEI